MRENIQEVGKIYGQLPDKRTSKKVQTDRGMGNIYRITLSNGKTHVITEHPLLKTRIETCIDTEDILDLNSNIDMEDMGISLVRL